MTAFSKASLDQSDSRVRIAWFRTRARLRARITNDQSPTTGLYFFGGSTPSKKYNFNFFLFRVWGPMDFDFGADPNTRV
jgi:hypothetical protein